MALELSDTYKRILDGGKFQSLLSLKPWPHFILDSLLSPESFRVLQKRLSQMTVKFHLAEDHPAKIQLSYMEDIELADLFFSSEMQSLLEGIAKCSLRPNKELAIQFRRMTPESPIFPPHVDLIESPSLVSLYYVAPGWSASKGGEILLLKEERANWFDRSTKWIAPIQNRLILFMSCDKHWHCVRKVNDWTRLMVLTEWLKVA